MDKTTETQENNRLHLLLLHVKMNLISFGKNVDTLEAEMFHNKRIFKKISLLMIILYAGMQLTGCGLMPELSLTDEQGRLVAEYAAGLLLKYDKGHSIGLEKLEDTPLEETPVEEESPAVEADTPAAAAETPETISQDEIPSAEEVTSDSVVPMAEAMGIDGFDVSYQSYEVCDIYPEEQSDDMVFSMQAAPGKELMIVHFNLTNTSEEDQLCDMVESDVMFRLIINGSERINEQTTILLNDLKQYQDTIAGYGMADTVLVFEITDGAQDNFESLQLLIKNGDEENTYTLQ